MNNQNKIKLIASGITLCCCTAAVGAFAFLGRNNDSDAVTAALTTDKELPVIVLDAGHGEST